MVWGKEESILLPMCDSPPLVSSVISIFRGCKPLLLVLRCDINFRVPFEK